MDRSWRPDERSRATSVPSVFLPLLAILAVAIVARWAYLEVACRDQRARLDRSAAELSVADRRQEELAGSVARQHQQLQKADGDLEMLRFEIEAVEMQLDGVDALSRQLRGEMGLPASEGTWSNNVGAATPQGGTGSTAVDGDRLEVIRARLANALAELLWLQDYSEHRQDAAVAARAPAADAAPMAAVDEPANWPARGPVTSDFGWRMFRGVPNYHTGIDIALAYGTPVQATADGTVIGSGWQPGYGWSVLLQHGGGYNTLYAHLSELSVGVGDRLRQGDVVGLSGSSGASTGPHLHYEIWRDGQLVDPRPSMDGTGRK